MRIARSSSCPPDRPAAQVPGRRGGHLGSRHRETRRLVQPSRPRETVPPVDQFSRDGVRYRL